MLMHRPVQEEDLPIICQFPQSEQELFFMFPRASFPFTVEQLQDAIAQRTDSTVILLDHRVVGFANFYSCIPEDKCSIGNVIVSPHARNQGVGQYLIETMVQIAFTSHHVRAVELSCFNHNTKGILFYSKLGFKPVYIEGRTDHQGNRVASIHMELSLKDHRSIS